jgi:hypothetical protein
MFWMTMQHPCRIACIGGLVLLSAAESRLWAGPLQEPLAPPVRHDDPQSEQKSRRKPLTLASTLPDPAPLRWAMSTDEIEESDPRLSTRCWTLQDDSHKPESLPPTAVDTRIGFDDKPATLTSTPSQSNRRRAAVSRLTSICRTGPPR